jgi:tetratricopeptide (TPR) repeat protein
MRRLLAECVALCRECGDTQNLGLALIRLAQDARARGEPEQARALLEESLLLRRGLGDKRSVAWDLLGLAQVALDQREHERATALCRECLPLFWEVGGRLQGIAQALGMLGSVAIVQERLRRAARLLGAAEACWQAHDAFWKARGSSGHPSPGYASEVAALRAALGEEALAAAWEEGEAMTQEAAIAYALADASPGERD